MLSVAVLHIQFIFLKVQSHCGGQQTALQLLLACFSSPNLWFLFFFIFCFFLKRSVENEMCRV